MPSSSQTQRVFSFLGRKSSWSQARKPASVRRSPSSGVGASGANQAAFSPLLSR